MRLLMAGFIIVGVAATNSVTGPSFGGAGEVLPVPDVAAEGWRAAEFEASQTTSGCRGGARYVRYNPQQHLWVGAELCDAQTYKLYLSQRQEGPFEPVADLGGFGQCDLVRGDVAGNAIDCPGCKATPWNTRGSPGGMVWVRSQVGDQYIRRPWALAASSTHTAAMHSCGVSVP